MFPAIFKLRLNPDISRCHSRYGYRDGDFERSPDGSWKEHEDAASWERRAMSRQPRKN